MKKYISLFVFLFAVSGLFAQKDWSNAFEKIQKQAKCHELLAEKKVANSVVAPECLPDSTVSFAKDGNDSIVVAKMLFQYNAAGQTTFSETYETDQTTGELAISQRIISQYNGQGALVFTQTWSNGSNSIFEITGEDHYFYKSGSTTKVDSVVFWSIDQNTGVLSRTSKSEDTYNADGLVTQTLSYIYENGQWVFSDKIIVEYNAKKKPFKSESYLFDGTAFSLSTTSTYTYNALDSLVLVETFDNALNEPASRISIIYDAAENSSRTEFEIWDADTQQFQFFFYSLADLDSDDKIELIESFFDFLGLFQFGSRSVFYYLNNSDCVSFTDDFFTEDGQIFQPVGPTYYYYDGLNVPTHSIDPKTASTKAFPNPFSESFQIDAASGSLLEMSDAAGKLLFSEAVLNQNQVVKMNNAPAGIYFLDVKSPNGQVLSHQKVVKF